MGRYRFLLLAVPVAIGGGSVEAQDRPRVIGTVRDEAGAPLVDVQVVVAALGRTALTDAEGRFTLRGLAPGAHRLNIARIGYVPVWREVVVPLAGSDVPLEVVLERTPLTLAGIEVTATATGANPLAVTQATTQLAGASLERELSATVAQTLARQPGIAVRYNGPSAAVPVMRGLTGDRILVLQDGQRTADLAGSAVDHGVTIDPLVAERVEVVRGPATLLYGNNALGGVVNVISADVPGSVPVRPTWRVGA